MSKGTSEKFRYTLEGNPLGVIRTHSDWGRSLNREWKLNAMLVRTPIPLYAEMEIKAMEVGNKVMPEKPHALTLQDNDRLES